MLPFRYVPAGPRTWYGKFSRLSECHIHLVFIVTVLHNVVDTELLQLSQGPMQVSEIEAHTRQIRRELGDKVGRGDRCRNAERNNSPNRNKGPIED